MPRYRGTTEGAATVIGRLLLLIAKGKHTTLTLAAELGVSPRQVNRYIAQLVAAGWQIVRVGVPTHRNYWYELQNPQIVAIRRRSLGKKAKGLAKDKQGRR